MGVPWELRGEPIGPHGHPEGPLGAPCEPTFGTQNTKSSRTGSRKLARFRAGDGSAQNFAADLMGLVKSFFEDFAS